MLLVVLLALSVPVAAVMGVLGLALNQFYASMPLHRAMGEIIWNASSEYILIAIPLFVMLGEILLRSGIAERVYNGIAQWLSWLPGGLMHANIGACAMFAATSGSSVATAATIGTVAIPEIKKHNYNEPLFLGTIAAGGTLGILIPPSINFILYGLLTNTSVPRLYLAGFLPGALLASFFMLTMLVFLPARPKKGRHADRDELEQALQHASRAASTAIHLSGRRRLDLRRRGDTDGSGFARGDRRAHSGRVGAAVSLPMLRAVAEGTMRTTAMIMLIIMAAQFLNFVLAAIGLTDGLARSIEGLGLGKIGTMILIVVVLPDPRLLHGDHLHDDPDHAVHRPDRLRLGLGSDLVGHCPDHPDRGGADHAARRAEPLCRAGHARTRLDQRGDPRARSRSSSPWWR